MLYENYAHTTDSFLTVPRTNGEKNLFFFQAFGENGSLKNYHSKKAEERSKLGHIVMYDQEPFFSDACSIFNMRMTETVKTTDLDMWDEMPWAWTVGFGLRSTRFPIWCHSELNSQEITSLEEYGFTSCYYWYHAFIARDWYRHWQFDRSLNATDKSDQPWRFLLYARDSSGTRAYRQKIIDGLSTFKDSVFFQWNEEQVSSDHSAKISIKDANSCGIHLVAETIFDYDKIHLTEKVFKPMVMSQPFIIWGPPGTLDTLKKYGFRTFDSVWSEEYDREKNHDRRMELLLDLVKSIITLSPERYQDLYKKCLPILEHNRHWFFGQDFLDLCWRELDTNFESAFAKKRELLLQNPGGFFFYLLQKERKLMEMSGTRFIARRLYNNTDPSVKAHIARHLPGLFD